MKNDYEVGATVTCTNKSSKYFGVTGKIVEINHDWFGVKTDFIMKVDALKYYNEYVNPCNWVIIK